MTRRRPPEVDELAATDAALQRLARRYRGGTLRRSAFLRGVRHAGGVWDVATRSFLYRRLEEHLGVHFCDDLWTDHPCEPDGPPWARRPLVIR